MKKFVIALVIVALALPAFAVAADVRIAQVYPGGGSTSATATYKKDYVVLFNATGFDLNISGYVLEYGSATGNWGSSATNYFVLPEGTWIAGCSYLMIACGSTGTGGADFTMTPDFITTNMSLGGTAGKMALFSALNANVACGSETPGTLIDKVAWGTANCAEGTAAGATAVDKGIDRNGGGTVDTDNNLADFTVVTNPVPMTSETPAIACAPVSTENSTFGTLKSTFR
jgi:hypothetical protein